MFDVAVKCQSLQIPLVLLFLSLLLTLGFPKYSLCLTDLSAIIHCYYFGVLLVW